MFSLKYTIWVADWVLTECYWLKSLQGSSANMSVWRSRCFLNLLLLKKNVFKNKKSSSCVQERKSMINLQNCNVPCFIHHINQAISKSFIVEYFLSTLVLSMSWSLVSTPQIPLRIPTRSFTVPQSSPSTMQRLVLYAVVCCRRSRGAWEQEWERLIKKTLLLELWGRSRSKPFERLILLASLCWLLSVQSSLWFVFITNLPPSFPYWNW